MTLSDDEVLAAHNRREPALVLYPLAHMAVELYNGMLSIMWPFFVSRFGLAFGALGLLNMVFRTSMTLPQVLFAALADRMGSRWFAILGLLCMATFMSLSGLSPTLPVLVMLLALAPLGSAAFHPAGTAHMTRSMPHRRATAVAVFMIGGTIGMSIGPLVGAQVYNRFGLSASPAFLPVGLVVALLMVFFLPADRPQSARRHLAEQAGDRIPPAIYLLMGVGVIQAWVENGLITYLTTLLTSRGDSLVLASQALFLFSAAAAGGIFLGGTLSDRVPRWRVIILSQVLCVPFYAGVLLLGGHGVLLASAGLGFVASLSHPGTVALGEELMPTRTSLASALTMGISWVIGSLGVVLTGFLADQIGLRNALLANTGLPVLGMACILGVRSLSGRVSGGERISR
jgi:MFS transporter, FSR family, fosmidomycin resistance protein